MPVGRLGGGGATPNLAAVLEAGNRPGANLILDDNAAVALRAANGLDAGLWSLGPGGDWTYGFVFDATTGAPGIWRAGQMCTLRMPYVDPAGGSTAQVLSWLLFQLITAGLMDHLV